MESIRKFKNCEIDNMQDVIGGRDVTENVNATTGKVQDKIILSNDGCEKKVVDNPGFVNWITGKRTVTTFDMCSSIPPPQD
jgi:hypothetical protein